MISVDNVLNARCPFHTHLIVGGQGAALHRGVKRRADQKPDKN